MKTGGKSIQHCYKRIYRTMSVPVIKVVDWFFPRTVSEIGLFSFFRNSIRHCSHMFPVRSGCVN